MQSTLTNKIISKHHEIDFCRKHTSFIAVSANDDLKKGVTFPLMRKVDVNGDGAHPLFVWLKNEARGLLGTRSVKWNFGKFLLGRDGRVLRRYAPNHPPEALAADIEAALSA